jgi:GAF domain-containing protein
MADKLAQQFDALCAVARELGREVDLPTLLPLVCRKVVEVTSADAASVRLLDEQRETLELAASHGLSKEYLDKGNVVASKSIADTLRGEIVWIEDATTDPRVAFPEDNRREGIRSILSVPLDLRGDVIGVLRLYFRERPEIGEDDRRFCTILAEQSALAIENARLMQTVRDMKHRLVERSSDRMAAMAYYDTSKRCR